MCFVAKLISVYSIFKLKLKTKYTKPQSYLKKNLCEITLAKLNPRLSQDDYFNSYFLVGWGGGGTKQVQWLSRSQA